MMEGNPSSSFMRIMGSSQKTQQEQPELLLGAHVGSSSSSSPSSNFQFSDNYHDLPHSWSQLLMSGLTGDEDKFGGVVGHFQPFKKLENWEDHQILNPIRVHDDHVKQEQDQASQNGSDNQDSIHHHHQLHHQSHMPVISSPRSCVTTSFSSNNINNSESNTILDFSNKAPDQASGSRTQDHSYECHSTAIGGVCKKARVHSSSSQPQLKVRKEKLGDRVTALHQLVSPFGKTDTASVLLEAIGYIRFLQGQIEALSTPYLRTQVNGGEKNNAFGLGAELEMDTEEKVQDLRSRGLCLVPVSYTQQVGSDNGADYWAPAFGI